VRIKIFLKRLLVRPARKLGSTVINLLILDIASAIYWYGKGWFKEPRTKAPTEEDAGIDIEPSDLNNERRW